MVPLQEIELEPLIDAKSSTRLSDDEEQDLEDDLAYVSPLPTRRVATYSSNVNAFFSRNEGFLLIGLSQVFFALINTFVKVLQNRIEIPVWQVIWIRMSVTGVGCVVCKSCLRIILTAADFIR